MSGLGESSLEPDLKIRCQAAIPDDIGVRFVSVVIRMKKIGRSHQSFFRVCAMDKKQPRHGRPLEELGTYDPMVKDTDARALLKAERIDYWLSVGALPSEKVAVLIKKYGTNGSRLAAQKAALELIAAPKSVPDPGEPASLPKPKVDKNAPPVEAPVAEAAPAEVAAETNGEATAEASEGASGGE
jgi:small subunit ribosomal protein S16